MSLEKKNMIYHIYWGTAGNAGLYLDEIYQSLRKAGYEQKVFVSYYYPFNYGEKIFFKRTEMEHCKYKGLLRKVVMAFEFLNSLFFIFIATFKDKPQIINYSYVSSGNALLLFFLKSIKRLSGARLIITCHDVVPTINGEAAYNKELNIKQHIYSLGDYFLIHNKSSRDELMKLFHVNSSLILWHPFPLMDLSKMDKSTSMGEIKYDFLFIGHMRQEKGISLLVDAWIGFHARYPSSTLCIAGNPNYYEQFLRDRKKACEENNITLKLGFINDEDYIKLVKSARCVVFPYTAGTNSGVISTVVSLNRDVITSNLGMFTTNPFVPKENVFTAGDVDSLVRKMGEYMEGLLVSDSKERVVRYKAEFERRVVDVYNVVMQSLN